MLSINVKTSDDEYAYHVLDVGCGASPIGDVNCDLLVPFSDLRLVPLNLDARQFQGKNFVRADVRFLPFRSRSFDVVHCSHVLEHLEDPLEALCELKRVSRKKVAVILPFGLFSIFDILWCGRSFGEHIRWLRKHHKHFFLMDPLKTRSFKLMFPSLKAALKKEKKFSGILRVPIPFQTLTVLEVD